MASIKACAGRAMNAGVAVNLLALGIVAAYLVRLAWAGDLIRLRNALLLQPAREEDFHWTPASVPADFRSEKQPPSAEFVAVVAALDLGSLDDWHKALRLAGHLTENAQDKGPLQDELLASYRGIRAGYGYCADFVKVFLALAHTAGLYARQWAFSFDGFGGHGHTFVEIYDRVRGKWLFLDPHNNFHVVDAISGEPLSALEFRDRLLGRSDLPRMMPNGTGRLGFVHAHKALDYFRRGADQWYMWWGNAVFSYYGHPLVRSAGRLSRVLAHLAANLVGIQPHIRIYPAAENSEAVRRMLSLRHRLRTGGALALGLIFTLAIQVKLGASA